MPDVVAIHVNDPTALLAAAVVEEARLGAGRRRLPKHREVLVRLAELVVLAFQLGSGTKADFHSDSITFVGRGCDGVLGAGGSIGSTDARADDSHANVSISACNAPRPPRRGAGTGPGGAELPLHPQQTLLILHALLRCGAWSCGQPFLQKTLHVLAVPSLQCDVRIEHGNEVFQLLVLEVESREMNDAEVSVLRSHVHDSRV
mmetsp:Transcript_18938/g.52170  ORF Transcript_18938/g.52170 Transcript_18938/m.52170 type:complete len:203 (+) Transcript_18938:373-981(+)